MRWQAPRYCETRVRKQFLWLPMEIDGEVRWWETATWEEMYTTGRQGNFWKPERWL